MCAATNIKKMNQPIISKTWVYIALTCIGLFLVWVIFRGCAPDNKHKDDKAAVDSIVKVTNERHVIDSMYADEYRKANEALAKETVIQKQKIAVLEDQLNASGKRASKLAYSVVNSKIVHDTVGYVRSCDSLVNAVADLNNILENYESEYGGLVKGLEFQLGYKDSVISIQGKEIAIDMEALNSVKWKYDVMYVDYSKVVKQNKRSRFLNRVLAGSVLILGGILLTK